MTSAVLQAGTKVSMAIRSDEGHFTIERTVGGQPIVRDAAGQALASRPVDVLGPIDVFSQHELAELAESPDYVAALLRGLIAPSSAPAVSVRPALRRNREDLLTSLRELGAIDEQIEELPRLREAVIRSESAGLDERITEQANVDHELGPEQVGPGDSPLPGWKAAEKCGLKACAAGALACATARSR